MDLGSSRTAVSQGQRGVRMTTGSEQRKSVPLSHRVVEAVANESGVEFTELEPLYYSIDPDCLDALFSPHVEIGDGSPRRLTFTFAGHRVHITHDGTAEEISVDREGATTVISHPDPPRFHHD